jgi:hypothetical protein
MLVTSPIDSIVACDGMLNATRGFEVVVVDEVVEAVVEVVVVVDDALVDVTPETCCEPSSEVNAVDPNKV